MNLFDIMTGEISRMSSVNRYSSYPAVRRENVAEHSFWVTFISYVIALELIEQGERVSVLHVLRQALTHDISEAISGDVIRSYKHGSDEIRVAMQRADHENTFAMVRNRAFGATAKEVFDAWQYAKAETTLEGQIVAFADMAAVAFYIREEHRVGNRALLPVLREAYEEWFSRFHTHKLLGQFIDQMFPGGHFFDMLREESLPARTMFQWPGFTDGIDGGPINSTGARAMMQDHSEGETAEYDSAGWPERDIPLG
jgi:5'-deoxynucleotidase YfbR-like HD superfamily hydrolase